MKTSDETVKNRMSNITELEQVIEEIYHIKLTNPLKALELAEETINVVSKTIQPNQNIPFLICYSNCLSFTGRFPESYDIISRALQIKRDTGIVDIELSLVLNTAGGKLLNLNQFEKALPLLLESKDILISLNVYENLILTLLDLGRCYDGLYDFRKAVESLVLAEDLARKHKYPEYLTRIALSLGNVYSDTQDLVKANRYYKKSAATALKQNDLMHYADAMSSISKIYTLKHKPDLALKAAEVAINIYKDYNNTHMLAMMYLNIGIILNETKRPSEALSYLNKALSKDLPAENPAFYFRIMLNVVIANFQLKKYQTALSKLKSIIPIAKKLHAYNLLMPAYLQGYYICLKQKKWKQALDFFVKTKNAEYIIWNHEKESQMRQLEAEFTKIKETQQAEIYKLKNVELEKKNKLISEQKNQLEIALNELDTANKAKVKLFSIIAHDLRGPLGSIYQGIELVADDPSVREDTAFIRHLQHSAFQIYNMTDNLLRWSATQMNKLVVNPQPVSVEQLINNVIEQLALIVEAKHIELVKDIEPVKSLIADSGFLEVVFRNLLSNAIKFTPSFGTVKIEFKQEGDFYMCNVIDNGQGIAPEIQNNIFDGQYSSTAGTKNEKGVGLGLPLIKELVEQMGGSVNVKSIPGKGSTFTFKVPVKP